MARRSLAISALTILTLWGCNGDGGPGARTRVEFTAEPWMRAKAETARLVVRDADGNVRLDRTAMLTGDAPDAQWPFSVNVTPKGGDTDREFDVQVSLFDNTGLLVGRQWVHSGFLGQSQVTATFEDACAYRRCADGYACVGQTCAGLDCLPSACVPACGLPNADDEPTAVPSGTCDLPSSGVYVDPSSGADDGEACQDPSTPCESLSFALEQYVATGRTTVVNVAPDQDVGPLVLGADASGTEQEPTVIQPWPGRDGFVTVDAAGEEVGVTITADHLRFVGFEVFGASGPAIRITESAGVSVEHGLVHDVASSAAQNTPVGAIEVDDEGQAVTVVGNVVHSIASSNAELELADQSRGVWLRPAAGSEHTIVGNEIVDVQGSGVHVDSPARVLDNRVRGPGYHGVFLANEATVEFNEVCGRFFSGVLVGTEQAVTARHNSLAANGAKGLRVFTGNPTVENNIFACNVSTGLEVDPQASVQDGYNLYFGNDPDQSGFASAAPETNVNLDPQFLLGGCDADFTPCDLRTDPDSPAVGAGRESNNMGAN